MSFNEMMAWLRLPESEQASEMLTGWDICREDDIAPSIKHFERNQLSALYKPAIADNLAAFLKLRMPFAPNLRRPFTIIRSSSVIDNIRDPIESLIREGFEPDYICDSNGLDYYWEEHFTLECVSKHVELPAHFSRQSPVSGLGTPNTQLDTDDFSHAPVLIGRKNFRELIKNARRKDPFVLRIRWFNSESAPPAGSALSIYLQHTGEDLGSILNSSTAFLSPLSRLLLTSKQIAQPAESWDTFFKFQIADRVASFIEIPDHMEIFRDRLVHKSQKLRWTAEQIVNADEPLKGYFIAYTKRLEFPMTPKALSFLWRMIKIERQFLEGGRSRQDSKKTRSDRKILAEHEPYPGISKYKSAAEIALKKEREETLSEFEISTAEINRRAEQMRSRDKYHRRKARPDEQQGSGQ